MSTNRRLQILGLLVLAVLAICAYGQYKRTHKSPVPTPTPSVTVTSGPTI